MISLRREAGRGDKVSCDLNEAATGVVVDRPDAGRMRFSVYGTRRDGGNSVGCVEGMGYLDAE